MTEGQVLQLKIIYNFNKTKHDCLLMLKPFFGDISLFCIKTLIGKET